MDIRMMHYTGGQAPQANGSRQNAGQSTNTRGTFAAASSNIATGMTNTTPVAAVQATQNAVNAPEQTPSFRAALTAEQRVESDKQHYQDLGRGTQLNITV